MNIQEYHPSPILIPSNVSVRRRLRRNRDDYDRGSLPATEIARYDRDTIFYDVWVADEPRRLQAVGPPLLNLARILFPVTVTCNGVRLKGRTTEYRKFSTHSWLMPESLADCREYDVRFQFGAFDCGTTVRRPSISNATGALSLMTQQKDNPVHWIGDWCRWHHRLHGICRIVLYDNNSGNLEQLRAALYAMSEEVEIVLVHWPFTYGPATSHTNRYGQAGGLNHYREMHSNDTAWTLCMDVDEYLVVVDDVDLSQHLNGYTQFGTSAVLFGSWIVPPIAEQPPVEQRSISSYTFREQTFINRALKYAFRPQFTRASKNHTVFPKHAILDRLRGAPPVYDRLANFLYWSASRRSPPGGAVWRRRVIMESPETMFFYHFRGLNTDWRGRERFSEQVQQFDPKRHVEDGRLQRLIEQAGLATQPSLD